MDGGSTITYLDMTSPNNLRAKACPDPAFQVLEAKLKQGEYNRFLYFLVGQHWAWTDKADWTLAQWQDYGEAVNLRTWVGYVGGSPAGYYELQLQPQQKVEIKYFGLAKPFLGRGLGGYLLTHAIRSAWDWGAERVWVHTCTRDHPAALANYQARGMRVYKTEEETETASA